MSVHWRIAEAAEGRLPEWAEAGDNRRGHMARVASLLDLWASVLGLHEGERVRWRALGYLHDALRDAAPERLRAWVPVEVQGLPGAILHGPAAAVRLRDEGVDDEPFLEAIAHHTTGDGGLDRMGIALYLADFLEPGRSYLTEWRSELRGRMPRELVAVAREVVSARIQDRLERGSEILPQTVALWNRLLGEEG